MPDFDITILSKLKVPEYSCLKCRALLFTFRERIINNSFAVCPVCKVRYTGSDDYNVWRIHEYLNQRGSRIKFDNLVKQAQKLATIADAFNKKNQYYPPMKALFEAIYNAEKFIHFTTYGLGYQIFGALKLKALAIPIRGIASNIDPDFASKINKYNNETNYLTINTFEKNKNWNDMPHQKLIVIDGLMAFKGSANLTDSGWRKAAQGHDHIEVVTNIKEIIELHNNLFSPIWAKFDDRVTTDNIIQMNDIPF